MPEDPPGIARRDRRPRRAARNADRPCGRRCSVPAHAAQISAVPVGAAHSAQPAVTRCAPCRQNDPAIRAPSWPACATPSGYNRFPILRSRCRDIGCVRFRSLRSARPGPGAPPLCAGRGGVRGLRKGLGAAARGGAAHAGAAGVPQAGARDRDRCGLRHGPRAEGASRPLSRRPVAGGRFRPDHAGPGALRRGRQRGPGLDAALASFRSRAAGRGRLRPVAAPRFQRRLHLEQPGAPLGGRPVGHVCRMAPGAGHRRPGAVQHARPRYAQGIAHSLGRRRAGRMSMPSSTCTTWATCWFTPALPTR